MNAALMSVQSFKFEFLKSIHFCSHKYIVVLSCGDVAPICAVCFLVVNIQFESFLRDQRHIENFTKISYVCFRGVREYLLEFFEHILKRIFETI